MKNEQESQAYCDAKRYLARRAGDAGPLTDRHRPQGDYCPSPLEERVNGRRPSVG